MRAAELGEKTSEADQEIWNGTLKRALRKRKAGATSGPAAKGKAAQRTAKIPKMATWEWLMAMDSSMNDTLGHGLEWYKPSVPDRSFNDDFAPDEADQDNVLVICTDEEQKQLAGFYFLERHLGLNVVRHQPPLHRRHNDFTNTLVRSGLYEVVALTVMQRNIAYGPWGKGGNLQDLWESAIEMMAVLTPQDPFLLKMWPVICKGRGWVEEHQTNAKAREKFLEELASYRPFATKGPRAAPSKWMSVINAIGYERPDRGMKLMGIAYLALSKGWVSDLDTLFCQKYILSEERDRVLAERFGSGGAASSSAAASSSGDPLPKAKASMASAKAKAQTKVSSLINKSQNALMAVGRLMANTEFTDVQEIVYILGQPLGKEHTNCIKAFKTKEGVLEYYKGMALGSWREPLWEAVDSLRQWHRFERVEGLTTSLAPALKQALTVDSDSVKMEDNMCRTIFRFLAQFLSERSASCQYSSNHYPGILGGLLGDETEQKQTFERFKADWIAYCEAKKSNSPDVQRMCALSSLHTRAMEQFARLAKQADWRVSAAVRERARVYFGGINQEDILEDSLGKVRDTEYRDASSRVVRYFKAYEVPVSREQLARWGREEITALPELPVGNTSEDHSHLFQPRPRTEMDLKGVMATGAQQAWLTFTPTTLRAVPGSMALLQYLYTVKGDFTEVTEAWRASVLPKHCFVVCRPANSDEETTVYFTLECTKYSVLGWPVKRVDETHVTLMGHGSEPKWHICFDLDIHYVLPVDIRSPLSCFVGGLPMQHVGIIGLHSAPVKVLEYQARHGFAGVPEESLRLLFGVVPGVEEPDLDPDCKVPPDIVFAAELSKTILPDISEDELQEALHERLTTTSEVVEGVFEDVLNDDTTQDCLREQDRKAMKEIVQSKAKAKAARLAHARNVQAYIEKHHAPKRGGRKKAKLAPVRLGPEALTAKGALRWWNSIRGDIRFINQWRPPVGSVTQDDANGRFLCSYPGRIRQSFSWTKRGMDEAGVQVLRKLWEWHQEAHPNAIRPVPV